MNPRTPSNSQPSRTDSSAPAVPAAAPPPSNPRGVAAARLDQSLDASILRFGRRLVRWLLLSRVLVLGTVAIFVPLLLVIADHVWTGGLPRTALLTAAGLWVVGVLAAAVALAAGTLLRRVNPLFAARHLEQALAIRHNSLVNALLLRRATRTAYACPAATRQAVRDVRTHPRKGPVAPRASRRRIAALGSALVLWLIYALVSPKSVLTSLGRFLGANLAAPTATRLTLLRPQPADIIHAGEPLEIELGVNGRSVDEVVFEILAPETSGGVAVARHRLEKHLDVNGRDRRRLTLAPHEVTRAVHFRAVGGDARLEGVIPVQPQPDITHLEIALRPPAYTGLPAAAASEPDLRVLISTEATFAVRANVPLREPVFVLTGSSQTRTRMTLAAGDPQLAAVTVTLTESADYRIEFTDPWGYPYRNPPQHRVVVYDDAPPRVVMLVPTEGTVPDGVVDVSRHPRLAAVATDDFGLSEVAFVQSRNGLQRWPLTGSSVGGAAPRCRAVLAVPTADVPLAVGEQVQIWFEASDNRVLPDDTSAPQTARSQVLTLTRSAEELSRPSVPSGAREDETSRDGRDAEGSGRTQPTQRDAESGAEPAQEGQSDAGVPPDESTPAENDRTDDGRGTCAGEDQGQRTGAGQGQSDTEGDGAGAGPSGGEDGDASAPGGEEGGQEQGASERPGGGPPKDGSRAGSAGGGTSGPSDQNPGDAEGELRRFEQEHGDEARALGGRLRGSEGGGAGERGSQSSPGDELADPPSHSPGGGAGQPGAGGGGATTRPGADAPQQSSDSGAPTEPPVPVLERGPSPESEGDTEILDLLELLERSAGMPEELLSDLGWSTEKADAFLRALERLRGAVRTSGGIGALRSRRVGRVGDATAQSGGGLSRDVSARVAGAERREDALERIAPPAEQRVPARLRALLDAYYQSLAAHRKEQAERQPTPR